MEIPRGADAGKDFATRFFGVARDDVEVVGENYSEDVWGSPRVDHAIPKEKTNEYLRRTLEAVDDPDGEAALRSVARDILGAELGEGPWEEALHDQLSRSLVSYKLADALRNATKCPTDI